MRSAMHSPVIVLRGAEGMRDALDGVHNGAGEVVGRIRLEFGSLQKQRDRERQHERSTDQQNTVQGKTARGKCRGWKGKEKGIMGEVNEMCLSEPQVDQLE